MTDEDRPAGSTQSGATSRDPGAMQAHIGKAFTDRSFERPRDRWQKLRKENRPRRATFYVNLLLAVGFMNPSPSPGTMFQNGSPRKVSCMSRNGALLPRNMCTSRTRMNEHDQLNMINILRDVRSTKQQCQQHKYMIEGIAGAGLPQSHN